LQTNATSITLKNITFTNANTTDAGPCGASDNSGCNAAVHLNGVTGATLDNIDITTTAQNGINIRETSGFSIAKARRVLGYAPRRQWEESLDETLAWCDQALGAGAAR
jgi:hypothetical protein